MTQNRVPPWAWLMAAMAFGLVVGGALGFFSGGNEGRVEMPGLLLGLDFSALLGLLMWLTAIYWRRLDEAAREAHKWAWFWGGNVALVPLVVGFAILTSNPDTPVPMLLGMEPTPAGYVATGGLIVVLTLLAGYTLAWLFWWLWKSRA